MPRGKKKNGLVPPPLDFVQSPFSKNVNPHSPVFLHDHNPDVKRSDVTENQFRWIEPDFTDLDDHKVIRKRRKGGQINTLTSATPRGSQRGGSLRPGYVPLMLLTSDTPPSTSANNCPDRRHSFTPLINTKKRTKEPSSSTPTLQQGSCTPHLDGCPLVLPLETPRLRLATGSELSRRKKSPLFARFETRPAQDEDSMDGPTQLPNSVIEDEKENKTKKKSPHGLTQLPGREADTILLTSDSPDDDDDEEPLISKGCISGRNRLLLPPKTPESRQYRGSVLVQETPPCPKFRK